MKRWLWGLLVMLPLTAQAEIKVVVLGDSLTEGYGLSPESAFPALIQNRLKKEGRTDVTVINAGISGSTTASGVSRLRWQLKTHPNVLVLALGANDGLRGVPVSETHKNLTAIIQLAKQNKLKILLAGMKLPPNYALYAADFSKVFARVAKEQNVPFLPFLLDGVAGNPSLNLPDGIHPNEEGHKVIAEKIYPSVLKLL